MEEIAGKQLPQSMAYDWTELTYLQLQAGNVAIYVFALGVVFVFLVLAAQYESWSLPLAVILVVPMCLLCSVTGAVVTGTDVNIFTQIGFVVLVGLAAKNAILIVEFAKQERERGTSPREAALTASRLRLRPILMTSLAFIFGVIPLVVAQGAGAEMRRALGVAVFSGMLGVTFFGIFLTPVFFYVIQWFARRRPPADSTKADCVAHLAIRCTGGNGGREHRFTAHNLPRVSPQLLNTQTLKSRFHPLAPAVGIPIMTPCPSDPTTKTASSATTTKTATRSCSNGWGSW